MLLDAFASLASSVQAALYAMLDSRLLQGNRPLSDVDPLMGIPTSNKLVDSSGYLGRGVQQPAQAAQGEGRRTHPAAWVHR